MRYSLSSFFLIPFFICFTQPAEVPKELVTATTRKPLADEESSELAALTGLHANSPTWKPDTFTEVIALLSKTHATFVENSQGQNPSKARCDALRESWFNLFTITDPTYTFENYAQKIEGNYRRCHISGIPPLHICLGLEKSEDITPHSISFLDHIVEAEALFKKEKNSEQFNFLRETFTGIYCRLEQEFEKPPFEEITKEQFLAAFESPETATEMLEKMFSLLRQSAYLAREQHDLELYKAHKKGPGAFEITKRDYLTSFSTLDLTEEKFLTITATLTLVGSQKATQVDLKTGMKATQLPQTISPHTVIHLVRLASSKLSSAFAGALSLLFPEKNRYHEKEE